jgi:putative phosphoribosyl transferase
MATRTLPTNRFPDRHDAGRSLAEKLRDYAGRADAILLALPRGGVPVAYEVAAELGLPLDVFVVRKLGVPGHEELAMGAIAGGGTLVLDRRVVGELEIDEPTIRQAIAAERRRLDEGERRYRGDRPPPDLRGRTAILVDDGLATGSSMRAAVRAVKAAGPATIVVAVPVAPRETCDDLSRVADRVVCAVTPPGFMSVGSWYEDFAQTSDDEVTELLERARRQPPKARPE